MRPLLLELEAFGPYLDRTAIDFEKLNEAGNPAAYRKVMDAVACFEQGNSMLAAVLQELD